MDFWIENRLQRVNGANEVAVETEYFKAKEFGGLLGTVNGFTEVTSPPKEGQITVARAVFIREIRGSNTPKTPEAAPLS